VPTREPYGVIKEREWWCEDTKKIIGCNSDGSRQYY